MRWFDYLEQGNAFHVPKTANRVWHFIKMVIWCAVIGLAIGWVAAEFNRLWGLAI